MAGILVYGFGPYQTFRENVSERSVLSLTRSLRVHRKVFDVKFDRAMFERTLERLKPEVVIGMGQHPRARKLRLERRARRTGCAPRAVSLDLPRTADTTVTYDAGRYVCNYSMWVVQGWCAKHGARFAFMHVPMNYAPARVARYLREFIRTLRTGGAARSSRHARRRSR